jgi:hypothetical protein
MDNKLKGQVIVSTSMILSATSAVASPAVENLKKDTNFDVSDDLIAEIDKITSKKDVYGQVSKMFNSLITKMSEGDKTLAKKYFSEYIQQDADGNEFVGFEVAGTADLCTVFAGCYTNCYSNCHSACHGACHGSRGWR